MKIGEFTQRVKSRFAMGIQTTNFALSSRRIYSMAVSIRSTLLEQKSNKRQKISSWNFQTLPFVEMERISEGECKNLGLEGCTVLRSKHLLPNPIMNLNRHIIASVTTPGGEFTYEELGNRNLKYTSGNRYAKSKIGYFTKGGRLYLSYIRGPKVLRVVGLFEDPIEAYNFPCACEEKECEKNKCLSYLELEFPVDEALITPIINIMEDEIVPGNANRRQRQQQRQQQPQQQQQEEEELE